MTIQEVTDTEVVQRCAKCDHENRIAINDLQVGLERGDDQVEDSVVPLPACPTCHAQEFLVRSPVEEQAYPAGDGSPGHLHRLIVDELHAELVTKGRVVERLKNNVDKVLTRPLAAATRTMLFKDGLKLPVPAVEKLQGKEPSR
jgi:hypothetical protein